MEGDKTPASSAKAATPMTGEQLLAVTVGERLPLNSTIHIASYDPAWPAMFARQAKRIRDILGDKVLLLEHVGSTSVPGLPAKPIIDMVLAVADSDDEASYVLPLETQAYALRVREPDWFRHRLLKPPDVDGNLHVFSAGCEEIDRMLMFRDWLRAHDDDRRLYEEAKRELSARIWMYTQNYADAKSTVIREILTEVSSSFVF